MRTTRPRPDSRRALKVRRDRVFSIFIRLRDRTCVLCGSTLNLECSHYHGRSNPESRVDPLNSHAMCGLHNQAHNSDREPYRRFLIRTYGEGVLDELERRMLNHQKQTDEEIKADIEEYEMLVDVLKSERDLELVA